MRSLTKIYLCLLSFIFLSSSFFSQTKEQKLDSLFQYCYENNLFNGSVLVAINGNVLYKNVFGYSNIENNEKLKLSTPSCIGSVSKQFTSMAIMILADHNKLTLEDTISSYFPELPRADKITIRHLLNHTSGTLRYTNMPELRVNGLIKKDLTNKDVYSALVERDSLYFEPGEKFSYTNSGYIILAMIVEKVSGQYFDVYLKENIFDPLKMNNTFVCSIRNRDSNKKAIGYNEYGETDDYHVFVYGAGGIYSTVEDLYKWDQALYTEKLVSKKMFDKASVNGTLNNGDKIVSGSRWGYGFGWLLEKDGMNDIMWHDGGFNGFSALIYRELNKKESIIILSNKGQMGTNAPIYPIQDIVLKILSGEDYKLPKIPIEIHMKKIIENKGIVEAVKEYQLLRTDRESNYDFSEKQLNNLGYYYLSRKRMNESITVFKLNTEMYPEYANGFDSLAEAYMKNGQTDLAIENFKKSLELNPYNGNAKKMLDKLKSK